ncbi:receptor L domain protein [Dictyocaulus viviparus]|uniref:Receptor L domain protein n=1 Tax=Dictyocaulus viviparus TaxID=29172 RepID=A0A0D8X9C9_DICVI|nr:receptor L domain protein [Dictyocaulus viviparus]
MNHFKDFTPIRGCKQYIANNSELCVGNSSFWREVFGDIDIYNNRMHCPDQCDGGVVNETYLDSTAACEMRIGDVVIADLTELPSNIDVLYNTRSIEGRLIIANNTGLGNFDYFKNVEVIGSPLLEGDMAPLYVEGNNDLQSLELSKLKKVLLHENGLLIVLRENDLLDMSESEMDSLIAIAGGSDFVDIHCQEALLRNVRAAVLLLPLILMILMMLYSAMKLRGYQFSRALSVKSRKILADMSKEILAKNPLVWMIQDRPLIWRYGENDPERNTIKQLKTQHENYLKEYAIEVLPNARIPTTSDRCIADRLFQIIKHEEILAIATEDDISLVIPALPSDVGKGETYNGSRVNGSSITLKLVDVKSTNDQTQQYTYNVTIVQNAKTIVKRLKIYLYVWDSLRLPISFDELLEAITLSTKWRMTCVSDRRKEIFFLLHMIFTYVTVLEQSISVVKAFQFHTDHFNGAPMDRCEMLCVMAFILEWANQTNSIPIEIAEVC